MKRAASPSKGPTSTTAGWKGCSADDRQDTAQHPRWAQAGPRNAASPSGCAGEDLSASSPWEAQAGQAARCIAAGRDADQGTAKPSAEGIGVAMKRIPVLEAIARLQAAAEPFRQAHIASMAPKWEARR